MIKPPKRTAAAARAVAAPGGYRRWREARERALSAHAAATDAEGYVAALVEFIASMRPFRDGLDEQDAEQFDEIVRRD